MKAPTSTERAAPTLAEAATRYHAALVASNDVFRRVDEFMGSPEGRREDVDPFEAEQALFARLREPEISRELFDSTRGLIAAIKASGGQGRGPGRAAVVDGRLYVVTGDLSELGERTGGRPELHDIDLADVAITEDVPADR